MADHSHAAHSHEQTDAPVRTIVLFGAGLYAVVGLPHAPSLPILLPDLSSLEAILRSSRPPLDGAVYVTGMLGWFVWAKTHPADNPYSKLLTAPVTRGEVSMSTTLGSPGGCSRPTASPTMPPTAKAPFETWISSSRDSCPMAGSPSAA